MKRSYYGQPGGTRNPFGSTRQPDSRHARCPQTPPSPSPPMPEQPFLDGAPVRVTRPGRQMDRWVGRFLQLGQDKQFAWVSFGRAGAVFAAPDERHYKKQDKTVHKLLPLSQLSAA